MNAEDGAERRGQMSAGAIVDLLDKRLAERLGVSSMHRGAVDKKACAAAVIMAGGSGERFGNPGGKQLFRLLGRPMLTWAIEAFDAAPDVAQIVVVCPDERIDEYRRAAIEPYDFVTPITFASSGDIRQESAMNGVDAVDPSYEVIAIHDGARPLVTPDLINRSICMLKGDLDIDGVVVGHPAVDTLKVVDSANIVGTPDRNMFWIAQTPQVFRSTILRRAYSAAMFEGFVGTDDSSLVERMGGVVHMVNGPRDNIKVTVPEDIGPAIAALAARLEMGE
ncbi:MAG: 2-C-methyl-D-erythritol 4-phosphate cytidylyltransferase [Coriobacteriales bacterium]